ncbi:DUF7537 family lipoprotein [Halorussus ruber]|uniref:DUF7537 family lipoprotein n=1 Tax=Halorussus ruber TaxID=1126238 RepID=UPI001091F84D|nr:hypothetical protein [Halorussus ruber]
MRRRALQLVAVCCLVALAGCSGALTGGGNTTNPTSAANATNATDAGSGPTLDDVSNPPGVSANGTDLAELSSAHAAALNGSSFTLAFDVSQNSSASNRSMGATAAVGPDRRNVHVTVSGANQSMETYATAEKRYLRVATGDRVDYRAANRTNDKPKLLSSTYTGTTYLDRFAGQVSANFTPTGVRQVDGETLVVLRANGSDVSAPGETNVTDYNATILVDEQGVVHRFEASARTERGDKWVRNAATMTISDVNETTVGEPAWLDEARNQTNS